MSLFSASDKSLSAKYAEIEESILRSPVDQQIRSLADTAATRKAACDLTVTNPALPVGGYVRLADT
jgi:hypothetical protein